MENMDKLVLDINKLHSVSNAQINFLTTPILSGSMHNIQSNKILH